MKQIVKLFSRQGRSKDKSTWLPFAACTLLLLFAGSAYGQQDPLYSQYLNTPMIINPAYAGFSRDLNLSLNYRKQWAGFDGSPQTTNLSGHMSLSQNKMGVGAILLQDKIGASTTTELQGVYAYHLPLTNEIKLSFGLQAGVINYKSDYSQLIINPNDPKFATVSELQPNLGAGFMITHLNYLVAASLPKMLQPSTNAGVQGLYSQNFYALGAYVFSISPRLRLKPYMLYRSVAKLKSSFDLGLMLMGDDSYTIGLFTRSFNTYGFLGQLKIGELLRLGYVFELPTNQSAGTSFTSHEIQLGLRIRALLYHDIESIRNF